MYGRREGGNSEVKKKTLLTNIFPLPKLFKGLLRSVPPIDPTNTICFTPAALAVSSILQACISLLQNLKKVCITIHG